MSAVTTAVGTATPASATANTNIITSNMSVPILNVPLSGAMHGVAAVSSTAGSMQQQSGAAVNAQMLMPQWTGAGQTGAFQAADVVPQGGLGTSSAVATTTPVWSSGNNTYLPFSTTTHVSNQRQQNVMGSSHGGVGVLQPPTLPIHVPGGQRQIGAALVGSAPAGLGGAAPHVAAPACALTSNQS